MKNLSIHFFLLIIFLNQSPRLYSQKLIGENLAQSFDVVIHGKKVLWSGYDGNDKEIFLFNGTTTEQLTNNDVSEYLVAISSNKFAWVELETSFKVVKEDSGIIRFRDSANTSLPIAISDSLIAWETVAFNNITSNKQIFILKDGKPVNLSNNNLDEYYPVVSGKNLAWEGSDGDVEIFLYDGKNKINLSNNTVHDLRPSIYENKVAWFTKYGTYQHINYYDGFSVKQLTTSERLRGAPILWKENIVWLEHDGNDSEIFYYNGEGIQQLTNNDYDEINLRISSFGLAYIGMKDSVGQVFLYKNGEHIQITESPFSKLNLRLSDEAIVWVEKKEYLNNIFFLGLEEVNSVKGNVSAKDFFLFPNPSNDNVTINYKSNSDKFSIKISDIYTNEFFFKEYRTNDSSEVISVDVSDLKEGAYFVVLSEAGNTSTRKLLITNK